MFLPHRALRLGLGTGGYGYLVAAGTAGELLAALLLTRMTWRAPLTAPMTAWAQSLRMRLVPPEAHGRLFALLRTVMQATPPAGAALAALVIGRGAAITVAAIAATIGVPALVLARDLTGTPVANRDVAVISSD